MRIRCISLNVQVAGDARIFLPGRFGKCLEYSVRRASECETMMKERRQRGRTANNKRGKNQKMKQKGKKKKKKKKKNEKTGERLACVIVIEAVMDGRWMMIRYGLEELCSEELYGQRRDRPSLNSFLEAGLQTGSFLFLLFSGSGCLSSSFYYYDYIFLFCFVSFWKM